MIEKMNQKLFLRELKNLFEENADAEKAKGMADYMKNRFKFLGLPRPIRDFIQKELFAVYKPETAEELEFVIRKLWQMPFREYHYVACDLLAKNKKMVKDLSVDFFEYLIETNSWWDSVDTICSKVIGPYYEFHKGDYLTELKSWYLSADFWKRRACIIFQLNYKENTDLKWLTDRIMENSMSKEFFLQKAIGWALRQYSRTNSQWVISFVEEHELMPLSKKEALRLLNE